jgi:hypothetical protein
VRCGNDDDGDVALADARYTMRWLLILCDVFVCFYAYSFLLSAALVSQRKSFELWESASVR